MELTKSEFKLKLEPYIQRVGELQREALALGIPVILTFDGMDAAYKGKILNRILLSLDPRGYKVYPIHPPDCEETQYPFLWRYWQRIPAKGRISIFDRSWHFAAVREHLRISGTEPYASEKIFPNFKNLNLQSIYKSIRNFERQLTDDNVLLCRFFLDINAKEQKKRLRKLSDDKDTAWRVTDEEKQQNKNHESWKRAWNDVTENTNSDPFDAISSGINFVRNSSHESVNHNRSENSSVFRPPWFIIDTTDNRQATLEAFSALSESLEKVINLKKDELSKKSAINKDKVSGSAVAENVSTDKNSLSPETIPADSENHSAFKVSILESVNLSLTLSEDEYELRLKKAQNNLEIIQNHMYRERKSALILLEGWDAAGKGGAIRRMVQDLDPRGYEVIPVAAPNDAEKARHYLWRFWRDIPKSGHITIFDRSWYGRVMVERVEKFCSESDWKRAYQEINEFESELTQGGIQIIKFFLHIDQEEQLRRFEDRKNNPYKHWKITDEDWRNREKWAPYEEAVSDMIQKTSVYNAPWFIIEANCKKHSRVKIMESIVSTLSSDSVKSRL
jgi:AMP-polyphosphate phosphotransferase